MSRMLQGAQRTIASLAQWAEESRRVGGELWEELHRRVRWTGCRSRHWQVGSHWIARRCGGRCRNRSGARTGARRRLNPSEFPGDPFL